MKKIISTLALAFFFASTASHAASITIVSTTTYNGAGVSTIQAAALPSPGVYMFDLVATALNSISGLSVWIQQQGTATGNYYTIANSTFTTCNASCYEFVTPDIYEGGYLRAQWNISSGSATISVIALPVNP